MDSGPRRSVALALAVTLALAAGVLLVLDGGLLAPSSPDSPYERTTVRVVDEDGSTLATVEVRIADTPAKRYTGLSDTESLARGEGMLFVHPSEGPKAYVMREMDFPLDIVFVGANGTITAVHHAPLPPEGAGGNDLTRYRGRAKYVLEVPMGYTNETGIDVGDRVVVPDGVRAADG